MTAALWLLGLTIVLAVGGLIGSSFTTQTLEQKSRRQAAERRELNREWRALESARATGTACRHCRLLPHTSWIVLTDDHDEDGD